MRRKEIELRLEELGLQKAYEVTSKGEKPREGREEKEHGEPAEA